MNDLLHGQEARTRAASEAPSVLTALLQGTGVSFNGNQPWDIQVHDSEVYQRILTRGTLGFGEAYMDGLWDCHALDEMFNRLLKHRIDDRLKGWNRLRLLGELIRHYLFNLQNPKRAYQVGIHHYDTGNDIFQAMLDPWMCYSCGYWAEADNLEQAQLDKMDLICRKLELRPGEHLLEIGSGWGGLARFAAQHYGVKVTGITVSKEQLELAKVLSAGLPITYKLMDYRALDGSYDKMVSVGMFEHVGAKNYMAFFDKTFDLLKPDGLFLLHTIGLYRTSKTLDAWIGKYIFPNGKLPSAREISSALEPRWRFEDWHNFGLDYDRTLMAWWRNFDNAWHQLEDKYGERFYRMWKYYLHSCAGLFRSRQGQLWQIVLSKPQRSKVYRSVR